MSKDYLCLLTTTACRALVLHPLMAFAFLLPFDPAVMKLPAFLRELQFFFGSLLDRGYQALGEETHIMHHLYPRQSYTIWKRGQMQACQEISLSPSAANSYNSAHSSASWSMIRDELKSQGLTDVTSSRQYHAQLKYSSVSPHVFIDAAA